MIDFMATKCLESLTLRNMSRGSNIPELLFASCGRYQGSKNIHCFPVFVAVADVIRLFCPGVKYSDRACEFVFRVCLLYTSDAADETDGV